nr:hypothetical protein SHINE37_40995 [Rhizobiaceae bacterium]
MSAQAVRESPGKTAPRTKSVEIAGKLELLGKMVGDERLELPTSSV